MIVFTVFNNTKWWTCTSYHVYFGALYSNCTLILKWLFVCFCFLFICFYLAWLCFSSFWFKWFNTLHYPLTLLLIIKVILHQLWVKNFFPENSIWNTAVPFLSYSCMFQVEMCSQQLEICKSVCMFAVLAIVVETY